MKRDSILNNERQPQEIDIDKLTDRNMVKMEEEDGKEETEINEPQIEDQGDGVVEMQGLFMKYLSILNWFILKTRKKNWKKSLGHKLWISNKLTVVIR